MVLATCDPTHHAEIAAIRDASKNLKSFHLEECDLYTSNEPCPMCLGACYWAHLRSIYYSSTIADARDYGNFDDDVFYVDMKKPPQDRTILPIHFSEESRPQSVEVWKEFQANRESNSHY
jgi:guanine deaminase